MIEPSSPSPVVAHSVAVSPSTASAAEKSVGELRRDVDDGCSERQVGPVVGGRRHRLRRIEPERSDRGAVQRAVSRRALYDVGVRDAGSDVGQDDIVLLDPRAVHRQAVVEAAEGVVLAPHDGADHRLRRRRRGRSPGSGRCGSASNTRSLACTSANARTAAVSVAARGSSSPPHAAAESATPSSTACAVRRNEATATDAKRRRRA